ncbi:polysaccharide deacetylase family protein [Anaerotardibacter muris]|uniref:polysaccharide deacetylase family protein n=1 Tax=Anaerotardibacter muris TaxID=2941505 RepID=UPI002041FFD4|nr:polysaccharide deacetylase family protein [Anaerotardibacter muris]
MRGLLKKPIVSLSFDDGRSDHFVTAKEILDPKGIPASFNITTACIEGKIEVGLNGHMSFDELTWMVNNPLFEVAAHGDFHKNDIEDISRGIKKLRDWYPDNLETMGFVSPNSLLSKKEAEELRDDLVAQNIEYVRIGRNISRKDIPKRVISKLSKVTGSDKMFQRLYESSLNYKTDGFVLQAVPVMKENTVSQMEAIVESAIERNAWLILELHSIETPENQREYAEEFCWDKGKFIELCDFLNKKRNNDDLEILTVLDAKQRG